MAGRNPRRISRREFIIHTSALGTATMLGCSRTDRQNTGILQVKGVCAHDCPDSCSWIVKTENGRAVSLEADPQHPLTRGVLCEKMDGFLTDVVYNPDRLFYPLKRVGEKGVSGKGQFESVSWDDALDDVASRLKDIIAEHGPTAILPYSFAGTEGMVQSYSLDRRFFARLGATRLERNICGGTTHAGVAATLGTSTCILPEDIQRSRFIIIWGSNPVTTNPHGWWASLLPGGSSANALTPDGLSDLGGGGAFYDAKVEVEKIG